MSRILDIINFLIRKANQVFMSLSILTSSVDIVISARHRGDNELFVPPDEVCCWEGKGFEFNHKVMIKVQELPPSIMVTMNLWSARV
jgi:hypothetical protein